MEIKSVLPILKDGDTYKVTSSFGYRVDPFTGKGNQAHKGIDLVLWIGWGALSSIGAAWDGVVTAVSYDNSRGNYVIIDHGDGLESHYYHLATESVTVSEGDVVSAGEKIGYMGSTGASTGAHLHFQLDYNGVPVDPLPYITGEELFDTVYYKDGKDDWWKIPLEWAKENKIIVGDLDGNLMLDEPCTRRQMMAFLYRVYKLITEGSVQ